MGFITLQVNQFSSTASNVELAIKGVISLIVGIVSAVLTSWVSKFFQKKNNNPVGPEVSK